MYGSGVAVNFADAKEGGFFNVNESNMHNREKTSHKKLLTGKFEYDV